VADNEPTISVVVPAHDAAAHLHECIAALLASDLPRAEWELIVVDDASTDSTPKIATTADRTIAIAERARGPAFARNRGAEAARAPLIAFVDADVCVHPDALRKMSEHFNNEPDLAAVFGSYDDAPTHPSINSQYRNLLHHYAHQQSAGESGSFWAGLGAIRRDALRDVGMFDERRYERPQIEDVELGYRLRQRGMRIVLDPSIRGTHLKRWTLGGIVRTDFLQRGVPWVRLLLERGPASGAHGPSLGAREIASVGLFALAAILLLTWLGTGSGPVGIAAALSVAASIAASAPLYLWFWRKRGPGLALASIPLYLLYNLTSVAAVVAGAAIFVVRDAGRTPVEDSESAEVVPSRSFVGFASGEAGSRVLAFVATAYIARRLGASAFGYLGFATAVVAYFGTALSTGISEIGSREVARRPADAATIAAGGSVVRIVAAVIGFIAIFGISQLLPQPEVARLVLTLTGLSLLSLAVDTSWVYKGIGRARRVGVALLIGQLVAVISLLASIRVPGDVVRVPVIQFLADLVVAGILIAPLLGRGWITPRISEGLRLLRGSGLITLSRILRTVIVTVDIVLLGLLSSSTQVGWYTAAYRIVFFVMAIAYASHIAWLPVVTRTVADGRPVDDALAGSLRLSLVATMPFVVGGILIAPQLMRAIFGEEYVPGAMALRLLMVSLLFIALHGASRNVFLAYNRLGVETSVMAVGAAVNVALNVALIPRYGLNGAALATAIAEAVIFLICVGVAIHFGIRLMLTSLVVPVVAGATMAAGIWIIGVGRPAVVTIVSGALIYGAALAVLTRLPGNRLTPLVTSASDVAR
jgi:O-antigen/teichoic acid export membrane protein/GT2 family glycosyltransferase